MADIFLSYAREDADAVERLAKALEAAGFSCWWDRQLSTGSRYLDVTERELKAAKAVVVLWSRHSIISHWVADEAGVGRDAGLLVPISFDGSMPPLGFRQFQVTDFSHWRGGREEEPFVRLTAALAKLATPGAAPASAARPGPKRAALSRRGALLAGAAGVAAAAGAGYLLWPRASSGGGARFRSVAVLPFEDRSPGGGQEFLAEGLAESLLDRLAKNQDLKVPARTSSFAFRGKGATAAEIARELNVETVLEGSVAREGDTVRIRAALSEAASGRQIWSETYDRDLTQLAGMFALQDEITAAIARELQASMGARPQRAELRPANPAAWQAFLEGNALMARGDTESARQAEDAYARAVAADPDFAPAHARLASALLHNVNDVRPGLRDHAQSEIAKAFALAPDLHDAILARTRFRAFLGNTNILDALGDVESLVAEDPANTEALHLQTRLQSNMGRLRKAKETANILQDLDPVGVESTVAAALVLEKTGRAAEELPLVQRALRLHPQDARLIEQRTWAHVHSGDYPALAQSAIEGLEATPPDVNVRRLAMLALGWAGCGDEALAVAADSFMRTSAWSLSPVPAGPPPLSPEAAQALPQAFLRAGYSSFAPTSPQARRAAWEAVHDETPYVDLVFWGARGYLPLLLAARRDTGDVEGARALEREIRDFHRQMEAEGWAGYERDLQKFFLAFALQDRKDLYRRWDAFFESGAWYAVVPYRPFFDPFRNDPEFKPREQRYEAESAKAKAFLEREGLLARARAVIKAQGWRADADPAAPALATP